MGSIKTQDIPVELRTWWKSFQKAAYRHDYSTVFSDFVTMTLTQFCPPGNAEGFFEQWHSEAMTKYSREEKDAFNEMYFEIFKVFQEQIEVKGKLYYDMFGSMYETIASNYKKSALGQFFTPESLVEVIVNFTMGDLKSGEWKRIVDPCSGSGRMIFVAHAHKPGNYYYDIDIDLLCCKMTALNMMLHGCVGEVVCGNALFLDTDWRFCLSINPTLNRTGIPSIMKIEKDCSFIGCQWIEWEKQASERGVLKTDEKQEKKGKKTKKARSQLNIFDA